MVSSFHISEPTEPKDNGYVSDEEYEAQVAEYEKNKEIYDEAVKTAGHTYTAADAQWSEDYTTVTFSALECSSVCVERADSLDLLIDTADTYPVAVTLDEAVTAEAEVSDSEGTCDEGVSVTYTAAGEAGGYKYTASTTVVNEPGEHSFTGEFEWTAETDEDGNVTGYTATATAACAACGEVYEDLKATVAEDEEAYVAPSCEAGGSRTYVATAVVTDEEGAELGTVTDTRTEEIPATGHNYENGSCTVCGQEEPAIDAPTILSAYSKEQTSVKVTWTPVENAYGYELWRAESQTAAEDEWTKTKTVLADGAQTTEDGNIYYRNVELEEGVTYYYKVRSFRVMSGSEYSAEDTSNRIYSDFSEVKYMPSAVVLGDIYSAATDKVRLNWTEVNGAHGYQIWRLDDKDGEYKIVKTLGDKDNVLTDNQGATTAYSNVGLEAGKTYLYKIRAFMIPGDGTKVFGAYSDEFTVAVMPEDTKIAVNSSKAGRANVSWDTVSGAAGYQIWMQESGGEYKLVKSIEDGNTDSYIKYDLKSGSTYKFKVRAYTQVGDKKTFGAYSNEVSVKVK